jgi:hypothetical protein
MFFFLSAHAQPSGSNGWNGTYSFSRATLRDPIRSSRNRTAIPWCFRVGATQNGRHAREPSLAQKHHPPHKQATDTIHKTHAHFNKHVHSSPHTSSTPKRTSMSASPEYERLLNKRMVVCCAACCVYLTSSTGARVHLCAFELSCCRACASIPSFSYFPASPLLMYT